MTHEDARRWLRRFCAGQITPGEFEHELYGPSHEVLRSLLADRTRAWRPPTEHSPYDELLEVHITHRPDDARRIVRGALEVLGSVIPNDSEVDAVERMLGVRLPRSFVELVQRGETTVGRRLPVRGPPPEIVKWLDADGCTYVDSVRGISVDAEDGDSVAQSLLLIEEWCLPSGLVLLSGDGHTWTALDYRASDEPRVVLAIANHAETAVVTDTFDQLLQQLEVELRR